MAGLFACTTCRDQEGGRLAVTGDQNFTLRTDELIQSSQFVPHLADGQCAHDGSKLNVTHQSWQTVGYAVRTEPGEPTQWGYPPRLKVLGRNLYLHASEEGVKNQNRGQVIA
jgi:hypothetical protein